MREAWWMTTMQASICMYIYITHVWACDILPPPLSLSLIKWVFGIWMHVKELARGDGCMWEEEMKRVKRVAVQVVLTTFPLSVSLACIDDFSHNEDSWFQGICNLQRHVRGVFFPNSHLVKVAMKSTCWLRVGSWISLVKVGGLGNDRFPNDVKIMNEDGWSSRGFDE